jgi:hypothetical protein
MSFDVHVTVSRGLSLAEINEAIVALEAPFAVGDLRLDAASDGSPPDWSKPFTGGRYQAYPLLPELSFESLGDAHVEFDGHEYTLTTDRDGADIALAVALAMARCTEDAVIFLSKTGEQLRGKLTKLEREVRKALARQWKDVEQRAARVPEDVAAHRRPRPEDTLWAHYERVALREAPESDVIRYLRDRLGRAIADGNDAEIDRLLDAAPTGLVSLEPLLDACSRAERPDVGRRVIARYRPHLREHFLAAVGAVGLWATPYVRFLLALGEIELDSSLLAEARSRANDAEMRSLLDGVARP